MYREAKSSQGCVDRFLGWAGVWLTKNSNIQLLSPGRIVLFGVGFGIVCAKGEGNEEGGEKYPTCLEGSGNDELGVDGITRIGVGLDIFGLSTLLSIYPAETPMAAILTSPLA